jgi:hypothetical protein
MNDAAATTTLTTQQVLDELEFLATVEHALVVEYLSVSCALGLDLVQAEGGATSPQGQAAAGVASSLAQERMFYLADICQLLMMAGQTPSVDRAPSIASATGDDVPLDPPTVEQLRRLLQRETEIASAVDHRFALLSDALTSTPPPFEADLLDRLRGVVRKGTAHGEGVTHLRDALGDPPPPDFLRASRRETSDAFEQRLLRASDLAYGLVHKALREQFAQPDVFGLRDLATSAMDVLDLCNHALVQRGLLPAFIL